LPSHDLNNLERNCCKPAVHTLFAFVLWIYRMSFLLLFYFVAINCLVHVTLDLLLYVAKCDLGKVKLEALLASNFPSNTRGGTSRGTSWLTYIVSHSQFLPSDRNSLPFT